MNRSIQILLVLCGYFLFGSYLPISLHQLFYAISLLIKDLLLWMMPVTVAVFIASAIVSFEKKALWFVGTLFVFECLSNGSSVWVAYLGGQIAASVLPVLPPIEGGESLEPLFRCGWVKPIWWSADKGSLIGFILGCLAALQQNSWLMQTLSQGRRIVEWILTKIFARLIPFFVLGFIVNMAQARLFESLFTHGALLLAWLVGLLSIYIAFLFLIGGAGSVRGALRAAKHLFPAAGLAFSSGCSISTMPWTIEGTAKNLQNPQFARAIIPATTNIQQIGDCLTNAFLCFLIYRHFYGHNPELGLWISFSLIFVCARFATAAVLGGAIFIMIPIYESYLAFTPEMVALILAFNVLLDPIITSCNVIANGALCQIFERVWKKVEQTVL